MGYTLWRNGIQLGELVIEYPTATPNFVAGMFAPAGAFTEEGGLVQSRLPSSGGTLFQAPITRPTPAQGRGVPLVPAAISDVPPERVLEVRDSDGAFVPVQSIMLHETRESAPEPGSPLATACAARGIAFSPWLIAIHFEPGATNAP